MRSIQNVDSSLQKVKKRQVIKAAHPLSLGNRCFAQQGVNLTLLLSYWRMQPGWCRVREHTQQHFCQKKDGGVTSSREAVSGIRTQSDWQLLLLFANIFENGNLICKLVDRDCSVHAYDGRRSFTSVQPSLCKALIVSFPFLLVSRDGNCTGFNLLF